MLHTLCAHNRTEHPNAAGFERHCHNEFELLLVLHGRGDYIVEGTRYPLRDGTLLFTRPREYHYVRPDPDTPYERYVINFDKLFPIGEIGSLPVCSPQECPGNGIYSASDSVIVPVRQAFALTDRLTDTDPDTREAAVRAAVTQAILLLSLQGPDRENATGNATIAALIDYINSHLTEELSLERLSGELFVSKYHLCRLFRTHTGVPILHYINTKRMALAAEWLRNGVPAEEAALRLGFSDYSAFYRRFLSIHGKSPAAFRK